MSNESIEGLSEVEIDYSLLDGARRVLENSGFAVAVSNLKSERLRWLLAENGLFALGVVAARTLQELVLLESVAADELSESIRGAGPKRWDGYLVLLAREDRGARGTQIVREIQYDTSAIRRVVGLGVRADEESVQRALRPFLPLPPPVGQTLGSAFGDLVRELELQGINRDRAQEAIDAFRATGSSS